MIQRFFYVLLFFSVNFEQCLSACARAEYEASDGECCPMCAPGNRVYRDCTEFTSTTCVPCTAGTFLDAPNGLKLCFNCMICGSGEGLRIKTSCTGTSDTVCEPLQGFYCKEENRGSCVYAKKHTECVPGQYIKQMGTAARDAQCEKCKDGTYSNGTMQNCQPHTNCEELGLKEERAGTAVSDTECGKKPLLGLIVGIVIVIILLVAGAVLIYLIVTHKIPFPFTFTCTDQNVSTRNQQEMSSPQQETSPEGILIEKRTTNSDSSCNPGPESPLRIPEENVFISP